MPRLLCGTDMQYSWGLRVRPCAALHRCNCSQSAAPCPAAYIALDALPCCQERCNSLQACPQPMQADRQQSGAVQTNSNATRGCFTARTAPHIQAGAPAGEDAAKTHSRQYNAAAGSALQYSATGPPPLPSGSMLPVELQGAAGAADSGSEGAAAAARSPAHPAHPLALTQHTNSQPKSENTTDFVLQNLVLITRPLLQRVVARGRLVGQL